MDPIEHYPHPLRSMQILADGLLLVSFYRTASQLSVFDLRDALETGRHALTKGAGVERVMKLPAGVMPFQTHFDLGVNSQKLILFQDVGVVCQRQMTQTNMVYTLRPFDLKPVSTQGEQVKRKSDEGCEII